MFQAVPENGLDLKLVLLFACLLTIAFPCESFLHAAFFARFQVEGMPLNFLDNVLLLDLTFEAA